MRADGERREEVAGDRDFLGKSSVASRSASLDLAILQTLELDELRLRWSAAFGIEPLPRSSRELLMRGIAYRLQERERGGVTKKVLRMLEQIASGKVTSDVGGSSSIRVGTRLIREWQGRAHEVIVVEGGFLWSGGTYRSLSEIARLITGTRWSGPRFFGLKDDQQRRTSSDG